MDGSSPDNPRLEAEVAQNERKVVLMPKREEMTKRLQEEGLLGIDSQADRFYGRFVDIVADSKKAGAGLNMAWELSGYDTLRDYPPMVRAVIDMYFDDVIDTVTPDLDVANQAKEFRKKMLDEMGKSPR